MPRCLLLLTVSLLASPTLAQPLPTEEGSAGGDLLAEASGKADILVIGAPERLLDIAGSGAIVSEDDLRRTRPFSVNDALRLVPGLFPRDEEGVGARPNIGIRGLNPTRSSKVLLLEDGIPLAFAPYGDNASYYHPPIERFQRIEVLKGAAQIRFGPQTIGGVVNYITPPAPASFEGQLGGTIGNRETWSLDGRVGGPLLGGRVLLHGNHKQSAGARDNNLLRFTDLFAKAEWDIGERHALTLKGSWFDENSQITYSGLTRAEFAAGPRQNPFVNDRFDTTRWNLTAAHFWQMDAGIALRTTAYYHHFDRDWWRQSSNSNQRPNDASDPACGGMANLLTACGNEGRLRVYDTWGVESRLTLDHADFLRLGTGGETEIGLRFHREDQRRRQWNGDTPTARTPGTSVNAGVRENNARNTTALAAFIQSSFELGLLTLKPGLRAEFVDFERRNLPVDVIAGGRPTGARTLESRGRRSLDQLVPGLGATLRLADGVIVYGGVHRGFAPPRVEDVITTTGGSVDLEAELSWNWEAGVRGSPTPGLTFDATFFVMDFENQIVPQSVAGGVGATLTSAGRTVHRGGELAASLSSRAAGATRDTDVFARLATTWLPTARYASTRIATAPCFDGAVPGTPVATGRGPRPCGQAFDARGNRLPYAPEWLLSAAAGIEHRGFTGQVELVGQSSMFADDVNLIPVTPDGQRGRIPGWTQVNLALAYAPEGLPFELFATARNLADRLIIVDRSRGILPGNPRLVQVGATLRF